MNGWTANGSKFWRDDDAFGGEYDSDDEDEENDIVFEGMTKYDFREAFSDYGIAG